MYVPSAFKHLFPWINDALYDTHVKYMDEQRCILKNSNGSEGNAAEGDSN